MDSIPPVLHVIHHPSVHGGTAHLFAGEDLDGEVLQRQAVYKKSRPDPQLYEHGLHAFIPQALYMSMSCTSQDPEYIYCQARLANGAHLMIIQLHFFWQRVPLYLQVTRTITSQQSDIPCVAATPSRQAIALCRQAV